MLYRGKCRGQPALALDLLLQNPETEMETRNVNPSVRRIEERYLDNKVLGVILGGRCAHAVLR